VPVVHVSSTGSRSPAVRGVPVSQLLTASNRLNHAASVRVGRFCPRVSELGVTGSSPVAPTQEPAGNGGFRVSRVATPQGSWPRNGRSNRSRREALSVPQSKDQATRYVSVFVCGDAFGVRGIPSVVISSPRRTFDSTVLLFQPIPVVPLAA
jgi:hypothetical protein